MLDINVRIDATEINEAVDVLLRHIDNSPEVGECFDARFPNVIDCVDTKIGSSAFDLKIVPSEAFNSFIQDLRDPAQQTE